MAEFRKILSHEFMGKLEGDIYCIHSPVLYIKLLSLQCGNPNVYYQMTNAGIL